MTARIKLTLAAAAALVALALYPLASYAAYGGVWVPADGYGEGQGFWFLVAPEHEGHNHVGSEVYGDQGSVGRLGDANGRDDVRASICDNSVNFNDAAADTYRVDNGAITKRAATFDGNGAREGCGVEIIGFSGERHVAYETRDFQGGGAVSFHGGF